LGYTPRDVVPPPMMDDWVPAAITGQAAEYDDIYVADVFSIDVLMVVSMMALGALALASCSVGYVS